MPTLHVYNSTNDWNKPHDCLCFLNSLIGTPNIPMATTCLTFTSQLPWAHERCSTLSETTHLFYRQPPDERDVGCCRAAQHPPPHTPVNYYLAFGNKGLLRGQLGTSPYPHLLIVFYYSPGREIVLLILLASASSDH